MYFRTVPIQSVYCSQRTSNFQTIYFLFTPLYLPNSLSRDSDSGAKQRQSTRTALKFQHATEMLVITFNSLGVVVVKFCLRTATLLKSSAELPQQHVNTVHQNIIMGGFQFSLQNSRKEHPKVVSLQQRFPNVLLRGPLFCGRVSLRT